MAIAIGDLVQIEPTKIKNGALFGRVLSISSADHHGHRQVTCERDDARSSPYWASGGCSKEFFVWETECHPDPTVAQIEDAAAYYEAITT